MKKVSYIIIFLFVLINYFEAITNNNVINTFNNIEFHLTGDYYHPNITDVNQKITPVIAFESLSTKGGQQIVDDYK